MTWARLDDRLDEHDKVEALLERDELEGLAALGLWVLTLTTSARRLTEGRVSDRVIRGLAPEHGQRLAQTLCDLGLYDKADTGWVLHDYLDYNPSRTEVLKRREERAESGRRGGLRSGQTRSEAGSQAKASPNSEATASAPTQAVAQAKSNPVPVPKTTKETPPTPPNGGEWVKPPPVPTSKRERDLEAFTETTRAYASWLLPDLPEPDRSDYVGMAVRHLAGGQHGEYTHDNVRKLVGRWAGHGVAA